MMKRRVLFLCTGNSCRSQMAEGWLRHLAGDRFEALSAGTNPVGVNPQAVEVMQEVGIDISHQYSKHVAEFQGRRLHYVITVCDHAQESCPTEPRGDVGYIEVLMILPMRKVPFLNACGFSGEYAMRSASKSKGGCERLINCLSPAQHPRHR